MAKENRPAGKEEAYANCRRLANRPIPGKLKNHTCSQECWNDLPLFCHGGKRKVMANKAVFLDRDRTLIEDPGYISDPKLVKLLPGVDVAIKSLAVAGYKIVVVTNQSGIARGMLTEAALEGIHDELRRQLAQKNAYIDAVYYCPFHPEGNVEGYIQDSDLRKPKPGMLLKAAADLDLDLADSWMVGDSSRDIEAGQRAGCRTILVRRQQQKSDDRLDEDATPDYAVRNLVDAARIILRGGEKAAQAEVKTAEIPSLPTLQIGEDMTTRENIDAQAQQLADEIFVPVQNSRNQSKKFCMSKFFSGILFSISLVLLIIGAVSAAAGAGSAMLWMTSAIATGILSLTMYMMQKD